MKKLFYFLAAASVLAVACAKEEAVKENTNENRADGKVTLTASMPQFTDAETKASVSDAGVFSWTAGDIIDVVYEKSGSADKTYQFECTNASTGEFTNVDAIDDGYSLKTEGNVAFYPHEYTGTPSNQTFGSPEAAAKGFQMHATYSAGNLAFVHDNAMMKVTVTNVPYFAKKLLVGSAQITLSYAADQASVIFYVPMVATASAHLTIAVEDEAPNSIISKSSGNEVEISAAHFYELPTLAIGPVMLIKNNVVYEMSTVAGKTWTAITETSGNICFFAKKGSDEYCSWSSSDTNLKEVTISGQDYAYFVFPSTAAGETVSVEICNKDSSLGYPKSVREVTLASGTSLYDFAYGTGLKKSSEYFCYIYAEDYESEGAFIYAWNTDASEPFGEWDVCITEANYTGKTTMWQNGRVIRFLPKSSLSSTSKVKTVRAGDTSWVFKDGAEIGSDAVDGQYYLGTYNHDSGGTWYSGVYTNTYADYLIKGVWK